MTEKAQAETLRLPDDGNYQNWRVVVRGEDTGRMSAYSLTTQSEEDAVLEAFRRFAEEEA